MKNDGFSSSVTSSVMALLAAGALAAVFVIAPVSVTGQPLAKGGKGGGGGFGGRGGGKQEPAGPVPRTKEGKPDLTGFWGGVQPGGDTSIEPRAGRRRGRGRGPRRRSRWPWRSSWTWTGGCRRQRSAEVLAGLAEVPVDRARRFRRLWRRWPCELHHRSQRRQGSLYGGGAREIRRHDRQRDVP